MIASYRHGFVFIKTRKTAGTSVEIALSPACGPEDVVTAMAPEDEVGRFAYGALPRNFSSAPELEEAYRETIAAGQTPAIARFMKHQLRDKRIFRNHMPASDARAQLDPAFWDSAFKFTVERHPYEKVVSQAYWRGRRTDFADERAFQAHLDEIIDLGRFRNLELYSQDGKLLVDRVLQYAALWPELEAVAAELGLSLAQPYPMAKANHRRDPRPADQILTPDQKRRVYERSYEEFQLFRYGR